MGHDGSSIEGFHLVLDPVTNDRRPGSDSDALIIFGVRPATSDCQTQVKMTKGGAWIPMSWIVDCIHIASS